MAKEANTSDTSNITNKTNNTNETNTPNKTNEANEWPILLFADQSELETWLENNHATSGGIRLQIAKKEAEYRSVTYAEALDSALCYGWIDSRKERHDKASWLQRFSRRGPRSIWSQVNKDKVERLIAEGRMKPSGLQAIEQAKLGGEWDKAYASSRNAELPEDFAQALAMNDEARACYDTLDRQNQYAMLFRIHNVKKAETRARKIAQFVEMLSNGEKLYP